MKISVIDVAVGVLVVIAVAMAIIRFSAVPVRKLNDRH